MVAKINTTREQNDELEKIFGNFTKSLEVSQSSTNLIRFNVEDILALPQLKAGKFTKNIQNNDIRHGTHEVMGIMEHQSKSKGVIVSPFFLGFPKSEAKDEANPSQGDNIMLQIDIQRFQ